MSYRSGDIQSQQWQRWNQRREPVFLFLSGEIGPEDERNLDIYEGYPRLYGKVNLEVQTEEGSESIMAYTMNEGHEIGMPSVPYLETITTGYLEAGFDVKPSA